MMMKKGDGPNSALSLSQLRIEESKPVRLEPHAQMGR